MAPKRSQKAINPVESLPRPGHKRAKIEDPVGDKVSTLLEGFADPQIVDIQGTPVCEMFLTTLPFALKVPRSERHQYQASLVSMIGEILNGSKDIWEQKVSDAQKVVDSTNADRSSAASARDAANELVKEQEQVVAKCSEQMQQHAEAEKAALQVYDAADKEVRDFDDIQLAKAKKLEECNSIYKEHFEAVQSPVAPLSAKDQKMHTAKLTAILKELSADASLLTALQAIIKKLPAERGTFDSVAMEQVDKLLKENIASLQADLDNSDSVKAQKMKLQAEAQEALDSAKEILKTSQEARKAASEDLMAKQAETKAALKTMLSKGYEADNATKHHAEQVKGLEKVNSLVSTFEFLLEWDNVVETEPRKEVDESSAKEGMLDEPQAAVEPQAMQEVA